MTTVTLGSPEAKALIARRRALGKDSHDEVWEGRYYMAPQTTTAHSAVSASLTAVLYALARSRGLVTLVEHNLGTGPEHYVVPDGAVVHSLTPGAYQKTALIVVEVLSPGDNSQFKVDNVFAALGVVEVLLADPSTSVLRLLRCSGDTYDDVDRSEVLEVTVVELAERIDWPEN